MPKKKRVYPKAQRRKARQEKKLRDHSEQYTTAVLNRFKDVSREQLFDPKVRTRRPTMARQILFALLFHVLLAKHNRRLVAEHLGFSVTTVSHGLKRVARAVKRLSQSMVKKQTRKICEDLELRPLRLSFDGGHLSPHKKKRSRR